jgi:hypothetical protein
MKAWQRQRRKICKPDSAKGAKYESLTAPKAHNMKARGKRRTT